jgi:hypothetical protein
MQQNKTRSLISISLHFPQAASWSARGASLPWRPESTLNHSAALTLNSEVDFGEAEFPQPCAVIKQALYQGTASAVPN